MLIDLDDFEIGVFRNSYVVFDVHVCLLLIRCLDLIDAVIKNSSRGEHLMVCYCPLSIWHITIRSTYVPIPLLLYATLKLSFCYRSFK